MNISNATLESANTTFRPCRSWNQENVIVNMIFSLLSIALNVTTLPFVVVMNLLVIIAIKTRRRLQTMYNILLASLAGTDLLVGIMSQPTFIAQEIYLLTGPPLTKYCTIYRSTIWVYLTPAMASLLLLTVLSLERFIAMKYSLKYASIVTTSRLTVAIVCSWLISVQSVLTRILTDSRFVSVLSFYTSLFFTFSCILLITFCHIVVYFVSRRHMKQIKSELVSREETEKFLKERKALRTTTIIIGFLFLAYTPGAFFSLVRYLLPKGKYTLRLTDPLPPFSVTCILINSFFNPIIYCWRNRELRKALFELLPKRRAQVQNVQ